MRDFFKVHTNAKEVFVRPDAIVFFCGSNEIAGGTVLSLVGTKETIHCSESVEVIKKKIKKVNRRIYKTNDGDSDK